MKKIILAALVWRGLPSRAAAEKLTDTRMRAMAMAMAMIVDAGALAF